MNAAPAPSAEVDRNCLRLVVEEVDGMLFGVFMMRFSLAMAEDTCKLAGWKNAPLEMSGFGMPGTLALVERRPRLVVVM